MRDLHLIRALHSEPWAILPEKLEAIAELIYGHAAKPGAAAARLVEAYPRGLELQAEAAAAAGPEIESTGRDGAIAVLRIYGVVAQRVGLLGAFSGGTSVERLRADLSAAMGDASVGGILLDIDSPGGSVYGIQEFASDLNRARAKKPIVAVANSLAASAAYWLGSQATEFYSTPGGDVGSVGVVAIHREASEAEAQAGVKTTILTAGKFKAEGNPYEPLSDDARSYMLERLEDVYRTFVSDVARGRQTTVKVVRETYGEGRVVRAKRAADAGMIDGIATYQEALAILDKRIRASRAAAVRRRTTAEARVRQREREVTI